jgi:hypothetical protein
MTRILLVYVALVGFGAALGADPVVDGKVSPGEYSHSQKLMSGKLVLSWQADADGGLYVAVTAMTKGWVAVGLGSTRMEGSTIYIGSVGNDGTPAFSEDTGKGHGHLERPHDRAWTVQPCKRDHGPQGEGEHGRSRKPGPK